MTGIDPLRTISQPIQSVPITSHQGTRATRRIFERRTHSFEPPELLHLADGTASDRTRLSIVARRPCRHVERDVLAEVFDRRDETAHGAPRSIGKQRLFDPGRVLGAISV